MTMTLQKLDRRYDGFDRFTHRVEFTRGHSSESLIITQAQWVKSRNWLWQQFGPSGELNVARPEYFEGTQPTWAWDANKASLYLTKHTLSMFLLKWEAWKNATV